ncbi:MAG: Maf family protein, partial [Anaerovorax sp.]
LKRKVFYEITEVFFKNYTDETIKAYLTTDEPWDKAGGYAIQGAWGTHVDHILGDYENVIGFPWRHIKKELVEFF